MSKLKKWRRWCYRIENDILIPYKFDKQVAEEYFTIIKPVLDSGEPADFHNWCTFNYGSFLAMTIRKLSDNDSRVYSVRRLVGDISANYTHIRKVTYINRYPKHFRDIAEQRWANNVSLNKDSLPKSVPLNHIDEIKNLTLRANTITNTHLAHVERSKNKKYSVEFDEMYVIIRRLISIAFFYSDLVGGCIADDDSNVVRTYDWQSIFRKPWIV